MLRSLVGSEMCIRDSSKEHRQYRDTKARLPVVSLIVALGAREFSCVVSYCGQVFIKSNPRKPQRPLVPKVSLIFLVSDSRSRARLRGERRSHEEQRRKPILFRRTTVCTILGDTGTVSRVGRIAATKVFKHGRKSPWVPIIYKTLWSVRNRIFWWCKLECSC